MAKNKKRRTTPRPSGAQRPTPTARPAPTPARRQPPVDRTRRRLIMMAAGAGAVLAIVLLVLAGQDDSTSSNPKIAGLRTFTVRSRDHVSGEVSYPQRPPVGGNHAPIWQNCGAYQSPIPEEQGVHSMEHGAVWITYRPDLPTNEVAQLRARAANGAYIVVSPFPGLPSPVAASAWGKQVRLPTAADARLSRFIASFEQGPQTPEQGALCTNGAGTPE